MSKEKIYREEESVALLAESASGKAKGLPIASELEFPATSIGPENIQTVHIVPKPAPPRFTYLVQLSYLEEAHFSDEELLQIKLEAIRNLAQALKIDLADNSNGMELKKVLLDMLNQIREINLLPEPAEAASSASGLLSNTSRLNYYARLKRLQEKVIVHTKQIKEASDLASLTYAIIDIQDFFLTWIRVTGILHTLEDDEKYNLLDFLKEYPALAVTHIGVFAVGALAYGSDQIKKKHTKEFNANPENVFSVLIDLYKKNRIREEELGITPLRFEEWRAEANQALSDSLKQEERAPDEKKGDVRLSDFYSQIELIHITDAETSVSDAKPENCKTRWALKLNSKVENLGVEPDEPKSTFDEAKDSFLAFMDAGNNFLTLVSLWFWIVWMNAAIAVGDVEALHNSHWFFKYVVQFIWPIALGLSYLSKLLFNYVFQYLNKKTDECNLNMFDDVIFGNITNDLIKAFPGLKSFFGHAPHITLAIDALGYIFIKAPIQAIAFPILLLSTLFASTEKAWERKSWKRFPLALLSIAPMLLMTVLYLIFRCLKLIFLDSWCSSDTQKRIFSWMEKYLFLRIFFYPIKVIWNLVHLPVSSGVSLFYEILPKNLLTPISNLFGFKKKIFLDFDHIDTNSDRTIQNYTHEQITVVPEHMLKMAEKRNLLANSHAISATKKIILWEADRHQQAIKDAELKRERLKFLSFMPKEMLSDNKEPINTGYVPKQKYGFNKLKESYYPTTFFYKALYIFSTLFFSWWGVSSALIFFGWMMFEFITSMTTIPIASISFGNYGIFVLSFPAIAGFLFAVLAISHAIYKSYQQKKKIDVDVQKIQNNEVHYQNQRENYETLEESEHNVGFYLREIQKYIDLLKKCGYQISAELEKFFLSQKPFPHALTEGSDFFEDVQKIEKKTLYEKNTKDQWIRIIFAFSFSITTIFILPVMLLIGPAGYWAYTGILLGFSILSATFLFYLKWRKHPDYEYYKSSLLWSVMAGMGVQSGILFVRVFLLQNAPETWLPLNIFGIGAAGIGPTLAIILFLVIGLAMSALQMTWYEHKLNAAKFMKMIHTLPERSYGLKKEVKHSQTNEKILEQRYRHLHQICKGMPEMHKDMPGPRASLASAQTKVGHRTSDLKLLRDDKVQDVWLIKQPDGYEFYSPMKTASRGEIYINTHDRIGGDIAIYYPRNPETTYTQYERMLYRPEYFPQRTSPTDESCVVLQISGRKYAFYWENNRLMVNEFEDVPPQENLDTEVRFSLERKPERKDGISATNAPSDDADEDDREVSSSSSLL